MLQFNYFIHIILNSKYRFFINLFILSIIYLSFYGDKIIYCTNEVPISQFAAPKSCTTCGSILAPRIDTTSTKMLTKEEINIIQTFLNKPEDLPHYSTSGLLTWNDILNKAETDRLITISKLRNIYLSREGFVEQAIGRLFPYRMRQYDPYLHMLRETKSSIISILNERGVSGR